MLHVGNEVPDYIIGLCVGVMCVMISVGRKRELFRRHWECSFGLSLDLCFFSLMR